MLKASPVLYGAWNAICVLHSVLVRSDVCFRHDLVVGIPTIASATGDNCTPHSV
jgi:hypothetical protein